MKITTFTLLALTLPACASDDGQFVSGEVSGIAADSKIMLVWGADDDAPPLKFGEGQIVDGQFTLDPVVAPPQAARFNGVFSVGTLVAVPSDFDLADGEAVDGTFPVPSAVGSDAVLYIESSTELPEWTEDFEGGLSCGTCRESGTTFDEFAPTDCASLSLDANDDPCNWS